MRVLYFFLVNFLVLGANIAQNEDDLDQDTPYMRQLLRLAKVAEIKSFMNPAADPCSDFYEFACGNYKHINPASILDVASTGSYESLIKGFSRKLQKILSTPQDGHDTPGDVQVKLFYESCNRLTYDTYKQQIKELVSESGSMPVLVGDAWREEDFDWLATTGRIARRYGVSAIIAASVRHTTVSLTPPKFKLGTLAEYLEEQELTSYLAIIEKDLTSLLDVEISLAKRTARELLEFEVSLVLGLQEHEMELKCWFLGFKGIEHPLDVERLVNDIEDIDVCTENLFYIQNLMEVITSVPRRTVANYIFYYLVQYFEFPSSSKRNEECIGFTRKYFAKSLDNMFYRRNEKAAASIDDIWHQIRSAFNRTLFSPELDWIQPSTRKTVHAKLQNMTLKIGSHVGVNFTQELEGLSLTASNYVDNLRQVKQMASRRLEPLSYDFSPAYHEYFNTITVPVAFLQQYYLWANVYPKALMFSTMGTAIGHELVHGFSGEGRSYSGYGTERLWDPQSNKSFLEREVCFVEQYGRYADRQTTVQDENIADNGGLNLALAAYETWMDSNRGLLDNERLPSLNYTAKQLFFLTFAQSTCRDIKESLAESLTPDPHASQPIRVIGSLSNLDDFSHVLKCPEGSFMNPKKKCEMY